jgi:hypothetical protein
MPNDEVLLICEPVYGEVIHSLSVRPLFSAGHGNGCFGLCSFKGVARVAPAEKKVYWDGLRQRMPFPEDMAYVAASG